MKRYITVLLLIPVFAIFQLQAQDIPEPMSPPCLVNDFAQIFDSNERDNIENVLLNYNDSTSTQIYVITVNDLNGYDISDYAAQLGQKWGIGQKDKNNGVVILIKPRIGNSRGQVFIASGYGLEPILTDGRIGRIIDEQMMPYLANQDYYNATLSAVNQIKEYLSGEFKADDKEVSPVSAILVIIIFIAFFVFAIYISHKNGGKGGLGGGFFGGGNSGGGSFGGGFGGGGGGSFGGGGAGRSFCL